MLCTVAICNIVHVYSAHIYHYTVQSTKNIIYHNRLFALDNKTNNHNNNNS